MTDDVRSFDINIDAIDLPEIKKAMDNVLKTIDQKLSEYYKTPEGDRPSIENFLEIKDVEVFSKEESSVNLSNVGYFFLEIFATLLGLSWGIISMFL